MNEIQKLKEEAQVWLALVSGEDPQVDSTYIQEKGYKLIEKLSKVNIEEAEEAPIAEVTPGMSWLARELMSGQHGRR